MRILHVIASLASRYGGTSKVCEELCRELARQGEQVTIYTTNVDGDEDLDVPLETPIWNAGVEIRHFPTQLLRHYKFSIPLAQALKAAIPSYDLVHIHSLYNFPVVIAAHYCRSAGVPYLIMPHGSLDPYLFVRNRGRKWLYEHLFEWRTLNRAAAIHFTTAEEHALTQPLGLKAPGVVVPIGVNLEDYISPSPPGAFRAAHPETQGKKIVLFLSRLNFKKGLDLLARAFGRIGRQRDDIHLVLAGPDNEGYATQVRTWLQAEEVLEQCTFTGMLLGEEKLAAFRDADVFVLPSYTENFGIAVVEAMACRVPVVISDKVNIWQEVAQAEAGCVVNCDPHALGTALLNVLDDPRLGQSMGQHGRRLVEERFTWEKVGTQTVQLYRHVASHNGQRRKESH